MYRRVYASNALNWTEAVLHWRTGTDEVQRYPNPMPDRGQLGTAATHDSVSVMFILQRAFNLTRCAQRSVSCLNPKG